MLTKSPPHDSPTACVSKNTGEVKGWGVESCNDECTNDQDCDVAKGYKCSCDGACGLTCNKVIEGKKKIFPTGLKRAWSKILFRYFILNRKRILRLPWENREWQGFGSWKVGSL